MRNFRHLTLNLYATVCHISLNTQFICLLKYNFDAIKSFDLGRGMFFFSFLIPRHWSIPKYPASIHLDFGVICPPFFAVGPSSLVPYWPTLLTPTLESDGPSRHRRPTWERPSLSHSIARSCHFANFAHPIDWPGQHGRAARLNPPILHMWQASDVMKQVLWS